MTITDVIMPIERAKVEGVRKDLLSWYDHHARVLPWRAPIGATPDPYHVWLSEIMLQQTTVPAVIPYFLKFLKRWPSVQNLAEAQSDDVMQNWAGLGYYARARNLHKCAKIIANDMGGEFPDDFDALKKLPGIGDYTAAAITAIAFNKTANVVDGNVERVMARLFNHAEPMPHSKPTLKSLAAQIAIHETKRPGDYAQGLMDLGATICTPSSPKCPICPIRIHCAAQKAGTAELLPARLPKAEKPQKHGYVYWITGPKGQILFQRRGEKGLLGGTIGLPTSEWVEKTIEKPHLMLNLKWESTDVKVLHTFTHFNLELRGVTAQAGNIEAGFDKEYFWATIDDAKKLGMPTVFKKAFKQFA